MSFLFKVRLAVLVCSLMFVGGSTAVMAVRRASAPSEEQIDSEAQVVGLALMCIDGDDPLADYAEDFVEAGRSGEEVARFLESHPTPRPYPCVDFRWTSSRPELGALSRALDTYFTARATLVTATDDMRASWSLHTNSAESATAKVATFIAADRAFHVARQAVRDAHDRRADVVIADAVASMDAECECEEEIAALRVGDAVQLLGAALHPDDRMRSPDLAGLNAGVQKLEHELTLLPAAGRVARLRAAAGRVDRAVHALIAAPPEAQWAAWNEAIDARQDYLDLAASSEP